MSTSTIAIQPRRSLFSLRIGLSTAVVAIVLATACKQCLASPTGTDWDGTVVMHEK